MSLTPSLSNFSRTVSLSGSAALIESKQTLAFASHHFLRQRWVQSVGPALVSVCEKRFLKFETLNPKISVNIVDFQSELATMNCEEGLCSSFQCAVKEILKFPMIVVIRHLKIEVKSSLERFLDAIISNIGWSHCCAVSSDSHSLGGEKLYLLVLNIGTVVVQRFYENIGELTKIQVNLCQKLFFL